jgi:flagellar assembly protein FliH
MKTEERTETGAVLRGVPLHTQPHALARPTRISTSSLGACQPADQAAGDVGAGEKGAQAAAYAAGHAQGLAEGRAAGRAAAEAADRGALQQTVEEACSKAVLQGRLEGLAAGRGEAEAEAERARLQIDQAMAERLERVDRVLRSVAEEAERHLLDAEDDLVALGHEALCRVLGAQAVQPASIRSMVSHVLAQHGQRAQLAVHVHPDDFAALTHEDPAAAVPPWRWVADDAVQLGGVVLRSPEGSLDARLETQMAALGSALVAARRERKGTTSQHAKDAGSSEERSP